MNHKLTVGAVIAVMMIVGGGGALTLINESDGKVYSIMINFNSNGGYPYYSAVSDTYDDSSGTIVIDYVIPTTRSPTREGYEFLGWGLDTSGSKTVMPGENLSELGDVSSYKNGSRLTLYACWEKLESYITATSGLGTEDNPYSGTIGCTQPIDSGYIPSDIYVEVGSVFNMSISSGGQDYDVDEPLTMINDRNSHILTGTASSAGTCRLMLNGEIVTTFHFVLPYSELTFTSSPEDGDIQYVG